MTTYRMPDATVHHGEALAIMRRMPDNSVDAIVTDPPYGLGFMGKQWDDLPPGLPWARECLRVLKPGGHLLAFGGTRTWHRLACVIEEAGFEMRDSIAWLYGSGFPKSLDVSKAIDKAAGAERQSRSGDGEHIGTVDFGMKNRCPLCNKPFFSSNPCTCPRFDREAVTEAAQQWQGWGTALKPAFEPVVVARKPLVGTVAANVLAHGTGALNIDGCRIGDGTESQGARSPDEASAARRYTDAGSVNLAATPGPRGGSPSGRWPANVVLDEDQAAALDAQSGVLTSGKGNVRRASGADRQGNTSAAYGAESRPEGSEMVSYGDTGGASRFFYTAKASKKERPVVDGVAHPTVKPLALMRWLVRLVTPPGGTVLDPFAGSGTTVEAAMLEGMYPIAIERGGAEGTQEGKYLAMIELRIVRARRQRGDAPGRATVPGRTSTLR